MSERGFAFGWLLLQSAAMQELGTDNGGDSREDGIDDYKRLILLFCRTPKLYNSPSFVIILPHDFAGSARW